MATATTARTIGGRELPAAGTYEIDRAHSSVEFVARHLMVAKVRGRFADVAGTIEIAEVPERSSVAVTIQTASVDTRDPQRDEHLRSADFFAAEQYPTIDFRTRGVRTAGAHWRVVSDLTIRGVTRPVVLDVEFQGATADPLGNQRAVFSATAEVDREEFGLTWNQTLESGGVLVGKRARIEIEVEAVRT